MWEEVGGQICPSEMRWRTTADSLTATPKIFTFYIDVIHAALYRVSYLLWLVFLPVIDDSAATQKHQNTVLLHWPRWKNFRNHTNNIYNIKQTQNIAFVTKNMICYKILNWGGLLRALNLLSIQNEYHLLTSHQKSQVQVVKTPPVYKLHVSGSQFQDH